MMEPNWDHYNDYIAAILGMVHPSYPYAGRINISPFGAPSIFHAGAIRHYRTLMMHSFRLITLVENMK